MRARIAFATAGSGFLEAARLLVLAISLPLLGLPGAAQELRATWLTRDAFETKAALATAMNTLASNHFNTVFVNVWNRGFTLWRSQVFSNHTGLAVDPEFAGRDILAVAVAEGHRNGLRVFAWFEYGFVGGYTGYQPWPSLKGPILDAHPAWMAKQSDGTELDASNFYWMTQARPEAQQFLIDLAVEVARRYDIDSPPPTPPAPPAAGAPTTRSP